jgi:hypothetical protein
MFKKAGSLSLVLLALVWLCSCAAQPTEIENSQVTSGGHQANRVTIAVTRDFGRELVLQKEVEVQDDTSALKALMAVASVETKYGGGFVSAINGISSEYSVAGGKKRDWFFYVNGIASKVGASDFILRPGDIEQWDFRDWSYHHFVPAIVGSYPQPFLSDYNAGTVIVYEDGFASDAEALRASLKNEGVSRISCLQDDRLPPEDKQMANLIIIAGEGNDLIAELNRMHKKLGFYAYLQTGIIVILDTAGNPAGEYGAGSSLIQATQNPWNPKGIGAAANVVWMVTGTDAVGIKRAADILINRAEELRHACAIVATRDGVIKVP